MRLSLITRAALSVCSISLFGALSANQPTFAKDEINTTIPKTPFHKLASKLVNRFWKDVEHADVKAYSKLLAPHFQGINISGVYTRANQIAGLKGLTVTSFQITKLVVARHFDTLVVSYDFTALGRGIVSGPSIDIWQKKDHKWKLISHTYVPFQTPGLPI